MKRNVGDLVTIHATGVFAPGIECIVMEVDNEGAILKARAVVPDERLLKHGFLIEGEDYIILQWNWSSN